MFVGYIKDILLFKYFDVFDDCNLSRITYLNNKYPLELF